jgi:hypothetical protein
MTDPEALQAAGVIIFVAGWVLGWFCKKLGYAFKERASVFRDIKAEALPERAPQGMEIRLCGLWLHQNGVTERFCCGDPECSTCYPMTRDQANEINQRFLQERGYGAPEQADEQPKKHKCQDYGHAGPKCGADDCWLRNE